MSGTVIGIFCVAAFFVIIGIVLLTGRGSFLHPRGCGYPGKDMPCSNPASLCDMDCIRELSL